MAAVAAVKLRFRPDWDDKPNRSTDLYISGSILSLINSKVRNFLKESKATVPVEVRSDGHISR